ncbi:hypothetical protein Bbelb_090690 [Branchiostoma belcheri]|nr:hypothetical protein Bbelb_090690 [Branchiostoma belcheri]
MSPPGSLSNIGLSFASMTSALHSPRTGPRQQGHLSNGRTGWAESGASRSRRRLPWPYTSAFLSLRFAREKFLVALGYEAPPTDGESRRSRRKYGLKLNGKKRTAGATKKRRAPDSTLLSFRGLIRSDRTPDMSARFSHRVLWLAALVSFSVPAQSYLRTGGARKVRRRMCIVDRIPVQEDFNLAKDMYCEFSPFHTAQYGLTNNSELGSRSGASREQGRLWLAGVRTHRSLVEASKLLIQTTRPSRWTLTPANLSKMSAYNPLRDLPLLSLLCPKDRASGYGRAQAQGRTVLSLMVYL